MPARIPGTILWIWVFSEILSAQTSAKVDFARDVQPIFAEHCIECHGPTQQMRGLRLDRRRGAMPNRVGANRASVVPGNSAGSPLYLKLIGKQPGSQMPPTGPLSSEQINVVKTWIDQGAEWPDELSGDGPTSLSDPSVVRTMDALRNGDRQEFRKILRRNPKVVNRKDSGGSTPIMYAALYGDVDSIRLLLEKGAEPNLQNDGGATALMYAVDNSEKTRLLLEHGADPNVQSGEGRTALLLAAGRAGSSSVVKLLLDHRANISERLTDGRTALSMAVAANDEALMQLLLDRGVEKTPLPLAAALQVGCSRCFEVLLKFADHTDLNSALVAAVRAGDSQTIKLLLDRGADAGSNLLTTITLSPAPLPADTIKALIAHGADVNARTSAGRTVLDLAKRQGDTPLVDLLIKSGAKEEPAYDRPVLKQKAAASVRGAIEKSIPLLQRADVAFIRKAGCVSCHNNSLTAMTMAAVRKTGIHVDEEIARTQLETIASYMETNRERGLEDIGIPGGPDTVGYILLGMVAEKYPSNATTDVWAQYMKNAQLPDGHWRCQSLRPPIEASDIEVTATALRTIRIYGAKSRRAEYDKAVELAVHWIEKAQPKTTEDRVFQLFGLQWAKGSQEVIRKAARELLALQRSDGGWGQLSTLPSDAYATGQALVALTESHHPAASSPAYERGIQFLLNSQLEDGSWYVRTRTLPIQPYFDSDFPHGADQFISAAATNWATMALATALRP